ncbi:MAG TPA: hypothetical protein VMV45_15550 [Casimicrobiaceae bacterium]|nr:hypothetical protein [Casimicrobiaceae bacterium]
MRRVFTHRLLWHTIGIVLAAAVAYLVFRGYRQPDMLIDFVNMRLC